MSIDSEITPIHDLKRGDHVIRWTYVYIYPIQIHGIVLSAGHDIVTICDFGLTGVKSKPSDHKKDKEVDEHAELEDMIDIEDKAMIDACETHKRESGTYDRINIITLVEEKDIHRWRKVNYGEAFTSKLSWNWWKKDRSSEDLNTCDTQVTNDESKEKIIQESPKDEESIQNDPNNDIKQNSLENQVKKELPKLQKSDPVAIVLARVRYLLSHQKDLPPHHLFFSNSECMAVWCKTGRWSTLQASVYLSSTAAGNLKTSILAATGAAKATTVVTAPATGILGWFGFTTTTTVPLLSVTPWLVPLLAGYGIVMVGTPMFVLKKAQSRWEDTTIKLNDAFWQEADTDVFVEAINSWSALH